MTALLPQINSPADLHQLTDAQLLDLAQEMRDELVRVLSIRPAHFASNLGVVELCLALHLTFDFSRDRLIWDTGHQIYPHKLITGRYKQFDTIRTRGGLMGYPNPHESPYDLFMTGHAGCSVSSALGLKVGDDLLGQDDRHSVAVIGDGALPSGIVFEALNNAGGLQQEPAGHPQRQRDVDLPARRRAGPLSRSGPADELLPGTRSGTSAICSSTFPLVGGVATQALEQIKDGLKAFLTGGMLFEELGFRYFGPVDGHDLPTLRRWLRDVKDQQGPVLLHVLTDKGHGVPQASADPVTYHTPPVFEKVGPERTILSLKRGGSTAYTDAVSTRHLQRHAGRSARRRSSRRPCARATSWKRCGPTSRRASSTSASANRTPSPSPPGLAKAGMRPIVDIYSTFLQRSFDQIFQEVALQNLPVVFTLDRAGLTGPGRPDASRRLRHPVPAAVPQLRRHGPRRRTGRGADAAVRPGALRPGVAALSQGQPGDGRAAAVAGRAGPGGSLRMGRGRRADRLRHAVPHLRQGGGRRCARRD